MANEEDGWTEDLPWIGQYILDDNGDPVPAKGLLSWGMWMEDHRDECQLGHDIISGARVSTIFLGLDVGSRFLRMREEEYDIASYKPRLWETMVFGGPYDLHQIRYSSRRDALAGHRKVLQMLKNVKLERALAIEGWMDECDLKWLAQQASGRKVIVELGCFLGRSTMAMLDNSEATVYALDDFYGPREAEIPPYTDEQRAGFYDRFVENMGEYIKSGRLIVLKGDHGLALGANLRPDMVFIDGSHEVEDVKRDIANWGCRLQSGGLLCGHDYIWWPSVKTAVDEMCGDAKVDPGTDIWYTIV